MDADAGRADSSVLIVRLGMRRGLAIAKATARELLGEPFAFLLLLSSLSLLTLAPAMHCHQFGEPSRMARDAGFSALLLGGSIYAAYVSIRTVRRECESGTLETLLSHPVSLVSFFLWKTFGCAMVYLHFFLTVCLSSLTVVNGAEIGGAIAARQGSVARIWGPSLAIALSAVVLPVVLGAVLNRMLRFRFVLTANVTALALSLMGIAYHFDSSLAARFLPVAILFAMPPLVLLVAAAAFAVRFRFNVTATLTVVTALLFLPAVGNYCLSDVLARGGALGMEYFWSAVLAIMLPILTFLVIGVAVCGGRDPGVNRD